MKGDLHQRLQALLHHEWKQGAVKQESLSLQLAKSQNSVSAYLRGTSDAGALDLDEAAAALHHVGSSLEAFLARTPPRTLTDSERLVRALDSRPEVKALLEDLLRVPRPQLAAVLELIGNLVVSIGRRGGQTPGSPSAPTTAARTTPEPRRRPTAPVRKKPK